MESWEYMSSLKREGVYFLAGGKVTEVVGNNITITL